jgi:hypothetical protein
MKKNYLMFMFILLFACSIGTVGAADGPNLPGTAPPGEENARFAIALDPFYLVRGVLNNGWGIGLHIEGALFPYLSLKLNAGYMGISYYYIDFYATVITAGIRGYLSSAVNGPFLGVSGGAALLASNLPDATLKAFPYIRVEGGYKLAFTDGKGAFIEPAIGYDFLVTSDPTSGTSGSSFTDTAGLGGFYFTILLGWSF